MLAWEPPDRLVLAWQVDGTWSYEPEVANASRVTISFAALGGQTRVTLVHDEFERHLNAGPDLADGVRDSWGSALRLFAGAAEPDGAAAHAARAGRRSGRPAGTCSATRACRTSGRWPSSTSPPTTPG